MFSIKSVLFLLIFEVYMSSEEFCDKQYSSQLFDTIFNYNETVYAYRKTDGFYILKYQQNQWQQISGPLKKSQLFSGIDENMSIDAVLTISMYTVCEQKRLFCRNTNKTFNPINVTFVFDDKQFRIFNRESETNFTTLNGSHSWIPWGANKFTNIVDILPAITTRIYSAILVPPYDVWPEYAVFLTDKNIIQYNILDKNTGYLIKAFLPNDLRANKIKNGGIFHHDQSLFFMSNNVYDFDAKRIKFNSLNQNYWDFFGCTEKATDSPVVRLRIAANKPKPTDTDRMTDLSTGVDSTVTNVFIADTTDIVNNTTADPKSLDNLLSDLNNEQIDNTTTDTSSLVTQSDTESSTDSDSTTDSESISDSTSENYLATPLTYTASEPVDQKSNRSAESNVIFELVKHSGTRTRFSFRILSIIQLIVVALAVALVICLAIFSYIVLSQELN